MKKAVSFILSLLFGISTMSVGFSATAEDIKENNNISSFISGITEIVREYDTDKDFSEENADNNEAIQFFSNANLTEKTPTDNLLAYTLQDFQTARLIVRAKGDFDNFGALEHVSGFEDFHILQYESPEVAMKSYEKIKCEKEVTTVAPDRVVTGLQGKASDNTFEESKDYLCEWSVNRTQSKRLQNYLDTNNIPMKEIVVGVIDTGVDYNHEFLEGRLISPDFNFNDDCSPDEEFYEYKSHGTAVSSVIVDNTPENVKIKMYNGFDETGSSTQLRLATCVIAAVEENVDLISASWTAIDDANIIFESLNYAYQENIPVFACVGNDDGIFAGFLPANKQECIAVTATDIDNTATLMNVITANADISAPGQDVKVAAFNNQYEIWSGTSFSTPCVASIGAIILSVYPDISVTDLKARLKETALPVKYTNFYHSSQGNYFDNVETLHMGSGLVQFCDAFGLENELAVPKINLETKVYLGEQKCEITCNDKNATILYTTDGTYPDLNNATIFTEPFSITERTRIRAVAYYENCDDYGIEAEATPRIQYKDSDTAFEIDSNGIINKYLGDIVDLYVPESINGIQVTGFSAGAFSKGNILSLTLPETIDEIPGSAFSEDESLEYIQAEGVTTVKAAAFRKSAVMYAILPNAKIIENGAFEHTQKLCGGDFSSVEQIKLSAFQYSSIRKFYGECVTEIAPKAFYDCSLLEEVYLPNALSYTGIPINGIFESCTLLRKIEMPSMTALPLKSFSDTEISEAYFPDLTKMGTSAFKDCTFLESIYMPSLLTIPKDSFGGNRSLNYRAKPRTYSFDQVTTINENAFGPFETAIIELSHLETAKSLPQTAGCVITLPSTFRECTEDTEGRNYKIYGTKGTYAETWANANGHEFIEISQETALMTDLPTEYTNATEPLVADVIGFNRTYQWYGNTTADNRTGTAIEGANGKEFFPADYEAYPYYYCVVTSTDVGYEPVEIRTGVTMNKADSADYSALTEAVASVPSDLSVYTEESVEALQSVLDTINYDLSISEQSMVDEYVQSVLNAIDKLEYKGADYSSVEAAKSQIPADLSVYTDESVAHLNAVLDSINYGLNVMEQSVVDEQTLAILDAINSLEYKSADYTEYNKAVEKANEIDRSLYKDLSVLDEVLSIDVSNKNITEQDIVDNQADAILSAISSLEYKRADYSSVEVAKSQIPADLSVYTDESVAHLNAVLDSINYGLNITEQSVVDTQTQAIINAISSLEYKPADYTEYNKAIEKANALDRNLYKDLTMLDEALAVDVSNKNITEQDIVDNQADAILSAISSLEYKGADYSKVEEAKLNIPSDLSIYTDETVDALNVVLSSIEYELDITEQQKVDGFAEMLNTAIENLQLKTVEQPTKPTTKPSIPPEEKPTNSDMTDNSQSNSEDSETSNPESSIPNTDNAVEQIKNPNTGGKSSVLAGTIILTFSSGLIAVLCERKRKYKKNT